MRSHGVLPRIVASEAPSCSDTSVSEQRRAHTHTDTRRGDTERVTTMPGCPPGVAHTHTSATAERRRAEGRQGGRRMAQGRSHRAPCTRDDDHNGRAGLPKKSTQLVGQDGVVMVPLEALLCRLRLAAGTAKLLHLAEAAEARRDEASAADVVVLLEFECDLAQLVGDQTWVSGFGQPLHRALDSLVDIARRGV